MKHMTQMMAQLDAEIAQLLACQVTQKDHPDEGGFLRSGSYDVEPRESGFGLSKLIIGYICKESSHYHSDAAGQAIRRTFTYMNAHQRADGCFDLSGCNFASPPDTAFMVNAVLNAWWLMEKRCDEATEWLKPRVRQLIVSCAEGIAAGGFHTPNHRWAIAACLKAAAKLSGREDFSQRADQYLNEGLDINEDGEFAERSAGNYNQVNDDQMLRLYIATGDRQFLEASRSNLEMMLCYIDPDDSVFTNNSTRQDNGRKVYLNTYYSLFLLTGYFLKDKRLGAAAAYMYQASLRHGIVPNGIEWLLLYPDLDGYGADAVFDTTAMRHYSRYFPASRIYRARSGHYAYTVMEDKPNFFYFQTGAFALYMVIYANLCDRRHFLGDKLETTDHGCVMTSHAASWYYLPFWPNKPDTSDWWAMDNPAKRERIQGVPLDTFFAVEDTADGVDVTIKTQGIDRLPFRLELSVLPCEVRGEQFLLEGRKGESVTLLGGTVTLTAPSGETITLSPAFGCHNMLERSTNAYPQSREHFTLYMTDYTPIARTLHISTTPPADGGLLR